MKSTLSAFYFGMMYSIVFGIFVHMYSIQLTTISWLIWSTVLAVGALILNDLSDWMASDDNDDKGTKA